MRYVLDTTALFNAKDFPIDFDIVITNGVLNELIAWGMSDRVRLMIGVRINVFSPSKESLAKVDEAAKGTGDIDRLSPTDREILALALEQGAPLITDDFSIQNTASKLGVKTIPMETQGIKKVIYWKYRCIGCGKVFDRKVSECDVCGQSLKPFKHRSE